MVNLYFVSDDALKTMGFKSNTELVNFVYLYGKTGREFKNTSELIDWVHSIKRYDEKNNRCLLI